MPNCKGVGAETEESPFRGQFFATSASLRLIAGVKDLVLSNDVWLSCWSSLPSLSSSVSCSSKSLTFLFFCTVVAMMFPRFGNDNEAKIMTAANMPV